MRRKPKILLGVGFLTMGIMGCMMNKEEDKEQLLYYLQHKYQEEFRYQEMYGGQLGVNYTAIVAENNKYPGEKILVRVSERDGRRCYEDNYLAFLLKEDIEQELKSIAEESFGACEVSYQIPLFVFPDSLKADMTADEFLSEKATGAEIVVQLQAPKYDKSICEERLEYFREEIRQKGYYVRGTVKYQEEALIFSIGEEGVFRYMRWLKKREEA